MQMLAKIAEIRIKHIVQLRKHLQKEQNWDRSKQCAAMDVFFH